MTCIDLDKYEFRNQFIDLTVDGANDDDSGPSTDFQLVDAEIIDYGISEDELEDNTQSPKERSLPSTTSNEHIVKTQCQASVNASSTPNMKCMCIKVVDCNKYPWYYTKYKNQILKWKSLKAVKHARNIIKYLKNDMNKLPEMNDLYNSKDISEKVKKDSTMKRVTDQRTSIIFTPTYNDKEYPKPDKTTKDNNSDNDMIQIQKVISDTSSTNIDIQKNKGLVGMKVQWISPTSKKVKEYDTKIRKKINNGKKKLFSDFNMKTVGEKLGNVCYSTNSDFGRTQLHEFSDTKADQSKKNNEKEIVRVRKDELKKTFDLKCSLKLNSSKILMKIKKITPPKVAKSGKSLTNEEVSNTLYNKENNFANKDTEKFSKNNSNKVTKYKPMPKSKKMALEYYKNIKQSELKGTEDQSNKKTEHLKTTSVIVLSRPTSVDKCSKINKAVSNLIQNNDETINKSILFTNKIKEKILKKYKITQKPCNDNIVSKINHKKNYTKKERKKKETINQLCAFKTVEEPQSSLMKNPHITNTGNYNYNKIIPLQYNELNIKQKLTDVAESTKNQENDTISINIVESENNFIKFNKVRYEISTRNNIAKSTKACKDVLKLVSPTNQLVNQHQQGEAVTKQMDNRTQPKHSIAIENTDKIENRIETNRIINEPNIQFNISSSHNPSESCEYIIPIIESSPHKLLNKESSQKALSSKPQQDNSIQNCDQYIPSESNIKECTSNAEKNEHFISWNSLVPVIKPAITSAPRNITLRPNILRRPMNSNDSYYGCRFQRPLTPLLHDIRYMSNRPSYGQFSCKTRPQTYFKQLRQWTFNQYRPLNYTNLPGSKNTQRVLWNNMNQHTGINYASNCAQQPVSNKLSHQKMPYNAQSSMPPGICDVQPNDNRRPCNVYNRFSNTPPQQLLPTPCQQPPPPPSIAFQFGCSISQKCSIIGENVTRPIDKINIPSLAHSNLNFAIESKKSTVKQENTNIDAEIPAYAKTVHNCCNDYTDNSADKITLVSTKLEMMEELEKAMKTVERTVKPELKRSYLSEPCNTKAESFNMHPSKQATHVSKSKPGPLSKRFKFIDTPPRNSQLIPKTGYSPPVLPIPTFENILSEVQPRIPQVSVANSKFKTTFIETRNVTDSSNTKNRLQNKSNKTNSNLVEPEVENFKKISLEEYKKRSLEQTKGKKMNRI